MPLPMRPFGRTGLQVPLLGFDALQLGDPALDEAHVARVLHHVLDAGLALIDTARSYGLAEERIARHLGRRRDEFVLSTKVGYDIAGLQASVNLCNQQALPVLRAARQRGRGTIALGPLALEQRTAVQAVYAANAGDWDGLV